MQIRRRQVSDTYKKSEASPRMQQDKADAPSVFSNYLISNPEEFAANILKAFEKGSEALTKLADRCPSRRL